MIVRVKICGITRREDACAAASLGFAYVGAVLCPRSRRHVSPQRLPELFADLPQGVRRVGVLVDPTPAEIEAALASGALDIIQLHGNESPEMAADLARRLPVWKAVTLLHDSDIDRWLDYPAERLLADSAGGGSGHPCRWDLAARLATRRPIVLAGGITPENAREAIATVHPDAIDLASGVESAPGIKSLTKMQQLRETLQHHE